MIQAASEPQNTDAILSFNSPHRELVNQIDLMLRARFPMIYLVTVEEEPVKEVLTLVAQKSNPSRQVVYWDIMRGWEDNGSAKGSVMAALNRIEKGLEQENTIFVLRDLHPILKQPYTKDNVPVVRELRNLTRQLKRSRATLILISHTLELPTELLETRTLLMLLEDHLAPINPNDSARCVAIAPDGQRVVSGHWHNTLKIWDLKTGILLRTLVGHSRSVICVAISSDNRTIVSGSKDETVKIWDLETGTLHRTLEGHSSRIYSVAISPDNRTIISSSEDKTVKIWDLETGTLLRTLVGHSANVGCVAISPNGRTVISGSDDQTIKIWDLETGNLLTELKCHSNKVRDFAMSPDGKTIVSLAEQDFQYPSKDNVIQIWKLRELNLSFYQES